MTSEEFEKDKGPFSNRYPGIYHRQENYRDLASRHRRQSDLQYTYEALITASSGDYQEHTVHLRTWKDATHV